MATDEAETTTATHSTAGAPQPDVLFVAGNARSLVANRGDLIRAMRDRGLSVAALVPKADYLPDVEDLGIPIYSFDLRRTGINPIADLRSFWQLVSLMRRLKPTMVFAYTIKPVVYGIPAARLAGVKRCFAMITGLGHAYTSESAATSRVRAITDRLYRAALGRSERVFFQNPDDQRQFVDAGILRDPSRAVRVNGSGVNLERFPERPLPPGVPHFLFIGRLLTEKGISEFMEAAAQVKANWPEARFTVVGGRDANLPHAVAAEDLERWQRDGIAEFVGSVKDVRPWLERSSVFVLPSYREGTPRAVLEAMATGRAIITTDAPGCRETVVDGVNGFLVPAKDILRMAQAMEHYLTNPGLIERHAHASLQMAREKYDVNRVNDVILDAMGVGA